MEIDLNGIFFGGAVRERHVFLSGIVCARASEIPASPDLWESISTADGEIKMTVLDKIEAIAEDTLLSGHEKAMGVVDGDG